MCILLFQYPHLPFKIKSKTPFLLELWVCESQSWKECIAKHDKEMENNMQSSKTVLDEGIVSEIPTMNQ